MAKRHTLIELVLKLVRWQMTLSTATMETDVRKSRAQTEGVKGLTRFHKGSIGKGTGATKQKSNW